MESLDVPSLVQAAINALTLIGAPVAAICVLLLLRPLFLGSAGRTRLALARRGLSDDQHSGRSGFRLLLLPLVGLTALTVSFAIEQEVREGPTRSIDAFSGDEETSWILQTGTRHLMNDSRLPQTEVSGLLEDLDAAGIAAVPFNATLAAIKTDRRALTGFVFAASPEAGLSPIPQPNHQCASADGDPCVLPDEASVIVDADNGIAVGDRLEIRGQDFTVVAHTAEPRSLINRLVVFVSPEGFARIEPLPTYYGVLADTTDTAAAAAVARSGLSDHAEVLTTGAVRSANEDFWAGNGTPLLLLLIGMISAFAGVASYLGQRAEQEHNRTALGTLWALGLTRNQMVEVQLLRSLLAVAAATPLAWVVTVGLLQLLNRSIVGFSADPGVNHLIAGAALLCIGSLAAAIGLRRGNRNATPFQAA